MSRTLRAPGGTDDPGEVSRSQARGLGTARPSPKEGWFPR